MERLAVRIWLSCLALLLSVGWPTAASVGVTNEPPTVLLVVGAPGEAEYATNFVKQAALWEIVCQRAGAKRITLGLDAAGATNDLERMRLTLDAELKDGPSELWLVLIGHGTFDGKEAKFNLRGPDLTATNLAQWLSPFHRPVAVVNAASASAPFLSALAGTNRVVITATRSGNEQNFTRFGLCFAEAIADSQGDLDQDGQTSLLEAFLSASTRVAELYQTEGRLATEHALIDDNGDGFGTPADWFRGTRVTKKSKDGRSLDGFRAHQFHLVRSAEEQQMSPEARTRRDELELTVARLREGKTAGSDDAYYRKLEALLLELGRLYETGR